MNLSSTANTHASSTGDSSSLPESPAADGGKKKAEEGVPVEGKYTGKKLRTKPEEEMKNEEEPKEEKAKTLKKKSEKAKAKEHRRRGKEKEQEGTSAQQESRRTVSTSETSEANPAQQPM